MTRRLSIGLLALVLLSGACSSISVSTQYDARVDFARYRTFAWVPRPSGTKPADAVAPGFRPRLERAVEQALLAKGLQRSAANTAPDLLLGYHAYLHLNRDVRVSNYGYDVLPSLGTDWGYDCCPFNATGVEEHDYEVGTLVLDVVEAPTQRLIWRGTARGMADPELTDQMLLGEARKLVDNFPPLR
jgi:hypothetical protein